MSETRPIRVLLVDDHQTMLWGLERLIDAEQPRMCVAGTASCGREAVAQAAALKPDVVLLDLDLGGENGADYLPALLANGVARVLVLTGERRHGVLDAAIHAGARGVLGKDAPPAVVVKAIEKIHAGELWLDREAMNRVFSTLLAPAPARDPGTARHSALTERERGVIQAIVDHSDCMNKVVAQRLFMSEHTLRNHLSSIYHKLGVKTRLELYVYATGNGLARLAAHSLH